MNKNMHSILLVFTCLLMLSTANEQLKFVFQYNSQGERTPMYTDDRRYDITRNNYGQGRNELTITGLKNEFVQGENFRNTYVNYYRGFLNPRYDPSEYFIRSFPDNPSIVSAYAFIMGIDSDGVEGLGLVQETGARSPVVSEQIDDTRRALSLNGNRSGANKVFVYSGNSDGFFFKDMHDMYPGIQRDFDRNIELAAQEYQRRTDNRLFGIVANAINVRREDINFKNLAYYLDDYVCAFANNMNVNPFNFDAKTHEMISEYFVYLIKHGMLRDPALNKVIAHPFLYSALREIMFKAQNSRELNSWEGPCVTNKVSLSFGNRLTFLAALEVLNLDHDAVYNPGWGDQLTFELFEDNNQLFVRILVNNNLITHIQRDGIIPINQFIEYLCSRLYFGDMSRVEQGLENYHEKAEIIGGSCQSLPQEEPLFGCKRKQNNSQCPYYNRQLGSSENDVNTDDGSNQYFDDDSSYIDEGDNMNPDDTSEMDDNNYRYMGAVESEVKHMLAKPSNRSGRR